MTLYALTTIHGPDGPGDVAQRGDPLPDWPDWFIADLQAAPGTVSDQEPEQPTVRPPTNISLLGAAQRLRQHTGATVHLPPDWTQPVEGDAAPGQPDGVS